MKEYSTPDAGAIRAIHVLCENGPHDVDVREFILNMPDDGPPRILTTYATTTPESAEQGDYADHGWKDQEGVDMTPDEFDIQDGVGVVDKAVKWLQNEGAGEASSSHFHHGIWYSTGFSTSDYRTGEAIEHSYHLKGFTEQEEQEIFQQMTTRRH